MAFLNGIEIIEIDTGGRTITTPSTSVIGIVGTAFSNDETANPINNVLPLNKPVLITSVDAIKELGLNGEGTIPEALTSIYNQANTLVIAVRIEKGETDIETIVNAAGSSESYTGVYALRLAETETKYKPKLLVVPTYSGILDNNKPNQIVTSLIDVAEKLRAVAIVDGTNTSRKDVIDFASNIGDSRVMVIDPSYAPSFNILGKTPSVLSSSAVLAGVFAKNDSEKGFWWSPSNTAVKGIKQLNRPISFAINDVTSDSNLMNEQGVTTIVFIDGDYRIWGNRSPSKDSKWNFISVRRTVDTVYDALEKNIVWALGRPITGTTLEYIQDNVNAYLSTLVVQGAILGGQCWIDKSLNPISQITAGQITVSFDLEPPVGLERLTFNAYRNNGYYETIFN